MAAPARAPERHDAPLMGVEQTIAPVDPAVGASCASAPPRRPVLRYHGGKWRLAPWIIGHFPEHRVYVEPFAGAASVLLRKHPVPMEVLNDLNGRIVSAFRVLRDPVSAEKLARLLRLTPYAKAEYVACREPSDDPLEDARRLLVLSFQGHGSTGATGGSLTGWRRGDRGTRWTAASDWGGLPDHVEEWSGRLRSVFLECDDAHEVIARYDGPTTLFYVDPPYVRATRHVGTGAYAHEMTDDDHRRLAERLHQVSGCVVLSGYDCDLYRELYPDWHRVAARGHSDKGREAIEVLWISPRTPRRQRSLFDVVGL